VTAISLVVSDVDGTLVDPDKRLTDASRQAVRRLAERGIAFTIVSSRPPFGMRMLVEPLGLTLPFGAFNGCALVAPDLQPIAQHLIPEAVVRESIAMLTDSGVDVWLFTLDRWLVRNRDGDYVAREQRTVATEPQLVASFDPFLASAAKIVGSSRDFDRLAQCEGAMRDALGARASVARSQAYYLDITAAGFGKGTFVEEIARRLAVPLEKIAVLGDMENDLAMFVRAGCAIAMGNASETVKQQATHVTASNREEGFAFAIERYVLGS
jgi:hypothetical protein